MSEQVKATKTETTMNDLAQIREWGERVLDDYARDRSPGAWLCAYTEELPTKSIRSTMMRLVDELETARTELAAYKKSRDVLIRFAHVWLGTGSDDEQLVMAHDFFNGVAYPPLPDEGER